MALLNINNNYIRLLQINDTQVKCIIYESEDARNIQKSAVSISVVLNKYRELISDMQSNITAALKQNNLSTIINKKSRKLSAEERIKLSNLLDPLAELQNEYAKYIYCLDNQIKDNTSFPLISQYIKDPENSLFPNTRSITINVCAEDTLEDIYKDVKRMRIFGETSDI